MVSDKKKHDNRSGSLPGDDIMHIIDALMDEDIDPKIKAKMQRWFIAEKDSAKKQEAFLKYADKLEPYTGALKGDTLIRYNRLANILGLKLASVKPVLVEPASSERFSSEKSAPGGGSVKRLGRSGGFPGWWRVAAVVIPALVIIGAGLFYLMGRHSESVELRIASADTAQSALLPDSSSVTVSPGSTLLYRESVGERKVELSGKALFKVKHDVARPFSVSSLNMKVQVLGTIFSVSDFPKDTLDIVSLYNGHVSIETDNAANTMSAGERLTYNSVTHEIRISIIPASEMIAKGYKPRLVFDHATFSEVFEALSAYYNVKIETAPGLKLAGGALTVDLEDEPLEESLGLLLKLGGKSLSYNIEEGKVIISKIQ